MDFKERVQHLLGNVKAIVIEAEHYKVTNEQWYLDFEDELNALSVRDHSLYLE